MLLESDDEVIVTGARHKRMVLSSAAAPAFEIDDLSDVEGLL